MGISGNDIGWGNLNGPIALASYGTYLYTMNLNNLYIERYNLIDGSYSKNFIQVPGNTGVTADSSYIYVGMPASTKTSIRRYDLSGVIVDSSWCSIPVDSTINGPVVIALAVDNKNVYFSAGKNTANSDIYAINKIDPKSQTIIFSRSKNYAIYAYDSYLYSYTDSTTSIAKINPFDSSYTMIPISSGGASTINYLYGIATDGYYIYMSYQNSSVIHILNPSTGAVVDSMISNSSVCGLVVVGNSLYAASYAGTAAGSKIIRYNIQNVSDNPSPPRIHNIVSSYGSMNVFFTPLDI
jgi:hypothetical protein